MSLGNSNGSLRLAVLTFDPLSFKLDTLPSFFHVAISLSSSPPFGVTILQPRDLKNSVIFFALMERSLDMRFTSVLVKESR